MKALHADGLLLLTSLIWGFNFVAQRAGMDSIGPFAFNASRFAIGALILLPLRTILKRATSGKTGKKPILDWKLSALSAIPGVVLFTAASLQQLGLVSTSAGNAGFITCLYVIIVPFIGILFGNRAGWKTWSGAVLAIIGLYILSIGSDFRMAPGDIFELIGAFFWASHIFIVAELSKRMEALDLAIGQFVTCAALSLAAALLFESAPFSGFMTAFIPIAYGGILSTGVAFTLQIIAQRSAHPARASILFSMEALFAAIGGVLLLGEEISTRLIFGGLLMLSGMIVAQTERHDAVGAT